MKIMRPGRNVRAAVLLAGGLIIAVLVLWVVSRNAPSSEVGDIASVPRASIGVSEGCDNFAEYWLSNTSVPIGPEIIEGFTNCRLADNGRWYVWNELPAGHEKSDSTIPEDQLAASEETRAQIHSDLEALRGQLSPKMQEDLGKIFSENPNAVIGQVREGASVSSIRTRYARIMNGFMLDPQRSALADYVGWVMETKINAYGVFRRACLQNDTEFLRQPCVGMEDNLSIRYAPWYWELGSEQWVNAYLEHLYGAQEETASS